MNSIVSFVRSAWAAGQAIDLDGVGYGRIHWGNRSDVKTEPSSYYRLLSGLAKVSGSCVALEIGTHWGGSSVAIKKGLDLNDPFSKLITVDITTESDNYLPKYGDKNIIKIVGDANSAKTSASIRTECSSVDLPYIDAAHSFVPTISSIAIYVSLLSPKIVVLDDVALNDEMRRLWTVIMDGLSGYAMNVSTFLPEARAADCGFGVIILPQAAPSLLSGSLPV